MYLNTAYTHIISDVVGQGFCMTFCPVYRRRQPFGGGDPGDQDEDFGMPGGNDGDSGSTGGGGGGDWGSDGEEDGGHYGNTASALWLWRALCVCSVLQVQSE